MDHGFKKFERLRCQRLFTAAITHFLKAFSNLSKSTPLPMSARYFQGPLLNSRTVVVRKWLEESLSSVLERCQS